MSAIGTRTEVLSALRKQLDGIGTEKRGAACLLTGAAGMGKTHVARHFLGQLSAVVTLSGEAPATGAPPLLPICRALASDSGAHVHDTVSAAFYEYSQSVPILKEALGPLVRVQRRMQHGASVAQEIAPRETHTFFVLAEMLRRVSEKTRTVLFLDDVQWLDASSLAFLGFLAEELQRMPLLVLLSARSNGVEPPAVKALRTALGRGGDHFTALPLGPLALGEVVVVAERSLKGPLECTGAEVEWLQRTSRGNPQYLSEVTIALASAGDLVKQSGRWRFSRPPESLVLPPSYRELVLERLEAAFRADADAASAVYHAAVLGREVDARVIALLLDRPIERVMRAFHGVAYATGLLQRVDRTTTWMFDHALTREAVLGEAGELAQDIHRRVAEFFAKDRSVHPRIPAEHFRAAGAWLEAAGQYKQASVAALHQFAFSDAATTAAACEEMLEQGGVPQLDEGRLDVARLRGEALLGAQAFAEADVHLAARGAVATGPVAARLWHLRARAKLNLPAGADHMQAVTLLREAARALEEDAPGDAVSALADLVVACDAVGDRVGAESAFARAFKLARSGALPTAVIRLLRMTCIFWQPEKVIEATTRALTLARKHKLRFAGAQCLNNLGTQHWYLRQFDEARSSFEEACEVLSASCGAYRLDVPTNNLGLLALVEGRLEEARAAFREANRACEVPGDRLLIRVNDAVALALMSDLDRAIVTLSELVTEADNAGDPFHRDCTRHNLARVLLLKGRADQAVSVATAVPPRQWLSDDVLVRARRANLVAEAMTTLGMEVPLETQHDRAALSQNTKPQAWLYRSPWDLCDLQFWQE